ncbi:MAG: PQQ-dependent sugar dehydrogenase [Proteobacteria bacterium]|nr:PQQ-dependent sugar dehydrogenase [Pseudomonadota bacterium]
MKNFLFKFTLLTAFGCTSARSKLVAIASDFEPKVPGAAPEILTPSFTDRDLKRSKIAVKLKLVASGLAGPTDFVPVPDTEDLAVVLTKNGHAYLINLGDGGKKNFFKVNVATDSEQGLLGMVFHPKFKFNRRFYLNYTPRGTPSYNRVAGWIWPVGGIPHEERVLIDVPDPYPNHNGGQLAFGPDGYLYVGYGDGGWMNDPGRNGQNLKTLLGSMARIDVDEGASESRPYGIPKDNPFLNKPGARPEIWAYGLRNPWRYSFSARGQLVVGDVGQDAHEEVTYLASGDNAGWSIFEGNNCHEENTGCSRAGMRFPITTYGRDDGQSITGGYEAADDRIPTLKGNYVFGDFVFGRILAMELPEQVTGTVDRDELKSLGKFDVQISSFGRDQLGRVYVAAFNHGALYRIDPK